jgi:hypothetical protein
MTDLRRLAEAATKGPWQTSERSGGGAYVRHGARTVADVRYSHGRDDAAFMAAANPQTVIALLNVRDAAEEADDAIIELVNTGWSSLSEQRALAARDRLRTVLSQLNEVMK